MKKTMKWIGAGIVALLAAIIAVVLGERRGEEEGRREGKNQAEIDKVKEAAKKGDTDTIDDAWRN